MNNCDRLMIDSDRDRTMIDQILLNDAGSSNSNTWDYIGYFIRKGWNANFGRIFPFHHAWLKGRMKWDQIGNFLVKLFFVKLFYQLILISDFYITWRWQFYQASKGGPCQSTSRYLKSFITFDFEFDTL